jgi:hypothetical protein
MGSGRVTDIEREAKLGGPLHSKGVMILWGYLAGTFAQNIPLALGATLVFEQSYGGVDGDSASSAELYALLSALAEVEDEFLAFFRDHVIDDLRLIERFLDLAALDDEEVGDFLPFGSDHTKVGETGEGVGEDDFVHLHGHEPVRPWTRQRGFQVVLPVFGIEVGAADQGQTQDRQRGRPRRDAI